MTSAPTVISYILVAPGVRAGFVCRYGFYDIIGAENKTVETVAANKSR